MIQEVNQPSEVNIGGKVHALLKVSNRVKVLKFGEVKLLDQGSLKRCMPSFNYHITRCIEVC